MGSKAQNLSGRPVDAYAIDRHFADIAPSYAGGGGNAADARARGAADGMWQKVEEDLAKIDEAELSETDDD
jgi:hypothetical protein